VYPNPSNDIFKINLSRAGAEIYIFDAMGKAIFLRQKVDTQESLIDPYHLLSGLYFFQAWNGGSGGKEGGGGEVGDYDFSYEF
jgi:hypothetical protein